MRADALHGLDTGSVGWKERRRVRPPARCVRHPGLHPERSSVSRVTIVSHAASTFRDESPQDPVSVAEVWDAEVWDADCLSLTQNAIVLPARRGHLRTAAACVMSTPGSWLAVAVHTPRGVHCRPAK